MGFKDMYYQKAILKILEMLEFTSDDGISFVGFYYCKCIIIKVFSDSVSITIDTELCQKIKYKCMDSPEEIIGKLDEEINEVSTRRLL